MLTYPDYTQPFIVTCDESTKAVGNVLSQKRDGEEKHIACCSRQLSSAESKHNVRELEMLTLIFPKNKLNVVCIGDN